MLPSGWRAWLVAGVLLFTCATACSKPASQPATSPSARPGVKVPLPEGWVARSAEDQALAIGPVGRAILRIDIQSGAGAELPSPSILKSTFANELQNLKSYMVDQRADENLTLVVLGLRSVAGSSEGASVQVLLGAKRIGQDLFLCATSPGASDEEVRESIGVCLGLEASSVVPSVRPTAERQ